MTREAGSLQGARHAPEAVRPLCFDPRGFEADRGRASADLLPEREGRFSGLCVALPEHARVEAPATVGHERSGNARRLSGSQPRLEPEILFERSAPDSGLSRSLMSLDIAQQSRRLQHCSKSFFRNGRCEDRRDRDELTKRDSEDAPSDRSPWCFGRCKHKQSDGGSREDHLAKPHTLPQLCGVFALVARRNIVAIAPAATWPGMSVNSPPIKMVSA